MIKKCILTAIILLYYSYSFAQSEYKKKELIRGITALIPLDFEIMSDDDMAQKYPTYKKPLVMYNDKNKEADFGLNAAVNKWPNTNLQVLKDMYKSTISSVFTTVEYVQNGVISKINGRNHIVFEFVSELVDDKRVDEKTLTVRKYTYLSYTLQDNKILIFNFTCSAGKKDAWNKVASIIMNSLKISSKVKLENFKPFVVDRPLPKTNGKNDPQMEAIKKLRENNRKLKQ